MTREARWMSGIILITVPAIQYGGYFLLTSLMNKGNGYMENPLRQNFFRAGHAHAGVIVILSLVCQILVDGAALPDPILWFVRIGVPNSSHFFVCAALRERFNFGGTTLVTVSFGYFPVSLLDQKRWERLKCESDGGAL